MGHGNFILLRDKYNAIIVDAGAEKKTVAEGYIRELFLACLGEATLRQIIITHDHEDHTNYVYTAVKDLNIKNWVNQENIPIIKKYENIDFNPKCDKINGIEIFFLQPLHKITTANKNDKSSVFVLTYQGIKVLFTGDATGLSLDNYVEKHQGFSRQQNVIVDTNRAFLENIHLFVMPHHGSSTEDNFRWTLYVTKHSPNLLASVTCGDHFESKYNDVRNWVRDISWPNSI